MGSIACSSITDVCTGSPAYLAGNCIAFSLSNLNGEDKVEPAFSLSHSYFFVI